MRTLITPLLLVVFITSCVSPNHQRAQSDSKAQRLLIGDWTGKAQRLLIGDWTEVSRPILVENITTLSEDGTFVSRGTMTARGRAVPFRFEGRWRVQDGVVISEITQSSLPSIIHVGGSYHDTIIALTKTEYRYRDDEGKEEKWLRPQNGQGLNR